MVHAIAAQFPFTGGGTLVPYQSSRVERYFRVAPGIEVSVEPVEGPKWGGELEPAVYDRRGRMRSSLNKGTWIDTYR